MGDSITLTTDGGTGINVNTGGADDELDSDDASGGTSGKARGRTLFFEGEFGTNGRTCGTCHNATNGALSPEEVEARFQADPTEPLFRPIDSDDGAGNSFTRLRSQGTIRVTIKLPPNVRLLDQPEATEVVLNRSVPTFLNVVALDPFLMADGRDTDPAEQARGAVFAHSEPLSPPPPDAMRLIADFERTQFTSLRLKEFALGGAAPELPQGTTESEKRGRRMFVEQPFNVLDPLAGVCATCHSGPMLNEISQFASIRLRVTGTPFALKIPEGGRFMTAGVSTSNGAFVGSPNLNPTLAWVITTPDGPQVWRSPDPGRVLITGDIDDFNIFRIPTLWGIKGTAPYFHDNSARDLGKVMDHYELFFQSGLPFGGNPAVLTPQDKADAVAFMNLL